MLLAKEKLNSALKNYSLNTSLYDAVLKVDKREIE